MRLLKIGRDASCNIVMHSDKVSSIHAELTILNSGDMMLEDKGSRNGTFIMNQRIAPGKPVNVKRGDAVRFADVELQWSQVPMPEDNSGYRAIFGIGSHFNNDIQISGATVSRYHATIKQGKDGKMYIIDHSKNGTTVDGTKITSNTPYKIKKKSSVVCGGVPVDLSHLPWKSDSWKVILGITASVALIVGLGFGVYNIIPSRKPSLQALQNATACVFETFYYEVTIKDDPFVGVIDQWPEKWIFGYDKEGDLCLGTLTNTEVNPVVGTGTAFFISEYGELGTNRHIACPWEYASADVTDQIRQIMQSVLESNGILSIVENDIVKKSNNEAELSARINDAILRLQRLKKQEIIISGSFDYIGVALAGTNFTTIADLQSCQVIASSDDDRKDVALLRLNSKQTPSDIVKAGFYDINRARTDEKTLLPQEEELTTIGFPAEFGTGNNIIAKGKEYRPTVHRTYISKTPDDDMFQLQSNVVGGQSGSPIIDKDHRLVGVVWGSHRGTEVAYGCNIKHLKELYDKNKVTK